MSHSTPHINSPSPNKGKNEESDSSEETVSCDSTACVTFSGRSRTAIYRGKAMKNKGLIPFHTGRQSYLTVEEEYSLVKTIMNLTDPDKIITVANIPDMVYSFFQENCQILLCGLFKKGRNEHRKSSLCFNVHQ
jgi:hypothetical protein